MAGIGTANPQNLQGTGPMYKSSPVINRTAPNAAGFSIEPGAALPYNVPPPAPGPSREDLLKAYAAFHPDPAPTPVDAITPLMNAYSAQFSKSQAAQQQALNAGLWNAMSGLGARRDAASAVAAQMPGRVNDIYNHVNADTARQNKVQGIGGARGADPGITALIAEGHASEKKGGLASKPLMDAGITADYSHGSTALSNTDMANRGALADRADQFALEMAKMKAGAQQNTNNQEASFAHDREMAILNAQLNPKTAPLSFDQRVAQQNIAAQNTMAVKAGFPNYDALQEAQASPYYSALNKALTEAYSTNKEGKAQYGDILLHGSVGTLLSQAMASNPNVVHALAAAGNPAALSYLHGSVK